MQKPVMGGKTIMISRVWRQFLFSLPFSFCAGAVSAQDIYQNQLAMINACINIGGGRTSVSFHLESSNLFVSTAAGDYNITDATGRNSYIQNFPEADRLRVQENITRCLEIAAGMTEGRFQGPLQPLNSIFGKVSDYVDLTNSEMEIAANLDVNGEKSTRRYFQLERECHLKIYYSTRGIGFSAGWQLQSDNRTRIAGSFLGTNTSPRTLFLGPGQYQFVLYARDGASYQKINLQGACGR